MCATDSRTVARVEHTVVVQVFVDDISRFGVDTLRYIAEEGTQRQALFQDDGILFGLIHLGIVVHLVQAQLGQLIFVERNIEIGIPLKLASEVLRREVQLNTFVGHLTIVAGNTAGEVHVVGQAHGEQQVGRALVVGIDRQGQARIKGREVDTGIPLHGLLPGKLGIGGRIGRDGQSRIEIVGRGGYLAGSHTGQIGVVAYPALVTVHTPAHTYFQIVDHVGKRLHERFARHAPSGRNRREVTPTMTRSKARRTIGTEVHGQQVAAVVVVGNTTQKRSQRPGRSRRASGILVYLVGGSYRMKVGVRVGKVESGQPGSIVLGALLGSTTHQREVVFVDRAIIGENVFEQPFEITRVALFDTTFGRTSVGGRAGIQIKIPTGIGQVDTKHSFEFQPFVQVDSKSQRPFQIIGRSHVVGSIGSQRVQDAGTIGRLVVLTGILGVPLLHERRGIDDRKNRTRTHGAAALVNLAPLGIGVGQVEGDIQPIGLLAVDIATEIVAFEIGFIHDTFLVGISARNEIFQFVGSVRDR